MTNPARHRVVVADDSAFMRRVLADALERAGLEVVGVAHDGDEALTLCQRLRPDVLSLDLAMPGTDGIAVLRELRAQAIEIPVVVVSAFSPQHGARAVDALAEGAFELVAKPAVGESLESFVEELGRKVRDAAATGRAPKPAPARPAPRHTTPARNGHRRVVLIACSTGGPRALADLVPKLPQKLGGGVVIVQHMPAGFTASLATRLDGASALNVREAADGDRVETGTALLAPGGSHLRIGSDGTAHLSDAASIGGLRPRADVTIRDAAAAFGKRLLLVVLTGMGKDGLDGAHAVRAAGGRILVEAESSCAVYGMPRAVSEANLADAELDLRELPEAMLQESGS